MTQIARPVATLSPMEWGLPSETTLEAWAQVDDAALSHDAMLTWIAGSVPPGFPAQKARFQLRAIEDPGSNTGHALWVAHKSSLGTAVTYPARLYQAGVLKSTTTIVLPANTDFVLTKVAFPEGEVAAITDYANLQLEVDTGDLAVRGGQLIITSLELRVPGVRGAYASASQNTAEKFPGENFVARGYITSRLGPLAFWMVEKYLGSGDPDGAIAKARKLSLAHWTKNEILATNKQVPPDHGMYGTKQLNYSYQISLQEPGEDNTDHPGGFQKPDFHAVLLAAAEGWRDASDTPSGPIAMSYLQMGVDHINAFAQWNLTHPTALKELDTGLEYQHFFRAYRDFQGLTASPGAYLPLVVRVDKVVPSDFVAWNDTLTVATFAVPLPNGLVSETSGRPALALSGSGLGTWQCMTLAKWPGGTVKWALFRAQMDPGLTAILTVAASGSGKSAGSDLISSVGSVGSRVFTLATGGVTATVKEGAFNLLDTVLIGATTIVATGTSAGILGKMPDGTTDLVVKTNATGTIKENGPEFGCLRIDGELASASAPTVAVAAFTCRFYVHAGSPDVRVTFTLRNATIGRPAHLQLSGIKLETKIIAGTSQHVLCCHPTTQTNQLVGGAVHDIYCLQKYSGAPTIDVTGSGTAYKPHITKSAGVFTQQGWERWQDGAKVADLPVDQYPKHGYMNLSGATAGCTIALRHMPYFWPASLRCVDTGVLQVGVFPEYNPDKYVWKWRQHESREAVFSFHLGPATAAGTPNEATQVAKRLDFPLYGRLSDPLKYDHSGALKYGLVLPSEQSAVFTALGIAHTSSSANEPMTVQRFRAASNTGGENNHAFAERRLLDEFARYGNGGQLFRGLDQAVYLAEWSIMRSDDFADLSDPGASNELTLDHTTGTFDLNNIGSDGNNCQHLYAENITAAYYLTGDDRLYDAIVDDADQLKSVGFSTVDSERSIYQWLRGAAVVAEFLDEWDGTLAGQVVTVIRSRLNSLSSALIDVDSVATGAGWDAVVGAPAGIDLRSSRHGIEAIGKVPSTFVRATRHGVEVLGYYVNTLLTKVGIEVIGDSTAAVGMRFSRHGVEAIAPNPRSVKVTKVGIEVIGDQRATRFSRHGIELVAKNPTVPFTKVTKIGIEVIGSLLSGGLIRFSRHAVEAIARRVVDKVVPLPVPSPAPVHLMANWRDPVRMSTAYQTDIAPAVTTGLEERRLLVRRPQRIIAATVTALSVVESGAATLSSLRRAASRAPVPIFQDVTRVVSNPSPNLILCDTRYRRFFVGGRVMVHDVVGGHPVHVAYALIASVSPDRLVLTAGLALTYAAGARVLPCLDAEVDLSTAGRRSSGAVIDGALEALEVVGQSALPGVTDVLPETGGTYAGVPVLDLLPDWGEPVAFGIVRPGEQLALGLSGVVTLSADRGHHEYVIDLPFHTRARFWAIASWFDGAFGRARVFWQVGAGGILQLQAMTSITIDVAAVAALQDVVDFLRHVAIRYRDDSLLVRGVETVQDLGGSFRLELDQPIPVVLPSEVVRVSAAELARFAEDRMDEEWLNDHVGRVVLKTSGMLEDKPVTIYEDTGPGGGGGGGEPPPVYDFGVKYEPPHGRVVQGVGHTPEETAFIAAVNPQENLPAVHSFDMSVGKYTTHPFPTVEKMVQTFETISVTGRMLTLGISMLDDSIGQNSSVDQVIATGLPADEAAIYYQHARDIGTALLQWNRQVILDLGMECNTNGKNHSAYFIDAYRKVRSLILEQGPSKISWCCSFEVSPAESTWLQFYPGDDVVDWLDLHIFTKDTVDPLGTKYAKFQDFMGFARARKRPMFLRETNPAGDNLFPAPHDLPTDPALGQAAWDEWFEPYYALIHANLDIIKGVCYVDHNFNTGGGGPDWHDTRRHLNSKIMELTALEFSRPEWLNAGSLDLLNGYTDAQP